MRASLLRFLSRFSASGAQNKIALCLSTVCFSRDRTSDATRTATRALLPCQGMCLRELVDSSSSLFHHILCQKIMFVLGHVGPGVLWNATGCGQSDTLMRVPRTGLCSSSHDTVAHSFDPLTLGLSRLFVQVRRINACHTAHLANVQVTSVKQILFCGVMTPTLLPVRPGLHSTDVGLL